MGNNQWSQFDRKILIFSFSESDSTKAIKALTDKNIYIKTDIGFEVIDIKHNKYRLKLWFLQSINRHLWIHHLNGTEGIIFYLGNETNIKDIKAEILFLLKSDKIKDTMILFIFEKVSFDKLIIIEKLRKDISFLEEINLYVNYLFISSNTNKCKDIMFGYDWICSESKKR